MRALRRAVLAGLFLLAVMAQASRAQGLACAQDCSDGTCAQVDCAPAVGDGFCECGGGALPWGEDVYLAYCRAWGKPQAGCGHATPAPDSSAISAAPAPLAPASAMETALASQNPYVAVVLKAMRDGDGWAAGAVHGLIHDAHYDSATGLVHDQGLSFVGQATSTGPDEVQIDITLSGNAAQLGWMQKYCAAAAAAAISPQSIHGTVTAGTQHGSLAVTGTGGRSQVLQW
jgi:hypothetical protein